VDIVITQWALDSYLDLKHNRTFSIQEYQNKIRPDVLLLRNYPKDTKFSNGKFWSPASDKNGIKIAHGFKMKWHQVGDGKVQLRLPIAVLNEAMLCEAYQKNNDKKEKRMLAKFKTHIQLIQQGQYTIRGILK
tara:strand:+ start:27393 stop:27791 length:399 start_codon:yes stop_codon:yes gene_type:complete